MLIGPQLVVGGTALLLHVFFPFLYFFNVPGGPARKIPYGLMFISTRASRRKAPILSYPSTKVQYAKN